MSRGNSRAELKSVALRRYFNSRAPSHIADRWTESAALRWDYAATLKAVLEELKLSPQDRVLDIGCGPGTWTREVARFAGKTVGLDLSEEMIARARSYTRGLPVDLVLSEFLSAPIEGKFDKVLCVRAMEYFPDKGRFARKVAEVLAPGGTVVLVTKTRFSIWRGRMRLKHWLDSLAGGRDNHDWRGSYFRQYMSSPTDIERAFAPYGIVPVRVRPVVLRPPVFRNGFHEISLVPERFASIGLAPCSFLLRAALRVRLPIWLTPVALVPTESFCITLAST